MLRTKKTTITVLGIDPGYDRMGISIIEKIDGKEILLFSDCFVTKKQDVFSDRLLFLGKKLENILETYSPTAVSVENLFVTKNQKTANRVSETRGMIIYLTKRYNIPVFEYTPLQIKTTVTGHGRAQKNQVALMVEKTIKLPKKKRLDDEIDAIACALTCIYKDINILSPKRI